jgi:4-hydroxy-tetrahydrodipicolinate synthase
MSSDSTNALTMFCMSQTPFRDDFSVDEDALRAHLRRLIAARNGIYMGSGGAGEGHVLTPKECRQIYDIAVDEVRGRVPLYCNPREAHSAAGMLEVAREAVAAGIDAVQFYQLDGGHGMQPTLREQEAYWKEVLDAIQHPVAISIHAQAGYNAPVPFLKSLCDRYEQIIAINVMGGQSHAYFMRLRDALPSRIKLYTSQPNVVQVLTLGGAGSMGQENNAVPHICQSIADGYLAGDMRKVSQATQALQRLNNTVQQFSEAPGSARGVKMTLKVLGLGNGVMRRPYVLPPDDRLREFKAALDATGVWDLEQSLERQSSPVAVG